jgi:two-component system chemotaxis response regulator CheY
MTKKFKILSVDDSKSIHAYLQQCLEPITEKIEHVYNGEEAIARLHNDLNAFDLIILDWEMPLKDGPTTFKELKAMGLKTPVMMLSSKSRPEDIMQMLEAGVADYMMKPFTADIVLDKINQVIN